MVVSCSFGLLLHFVQRMGELALQGKSLLDVLVLNFDLSTANLIVNGPFLKS